MLHCTPASSHFWQYGCILLEIFSCCFTEIAKEKTRLDADRVQAMAEEDILLDSFLEKLPNHGNRDSHINTFPLL
jgi:hypothetical protein